MIGNGREELAVGAPDLSMLGDAGGGKILFDKLQLILEGEIEDEADFIFDESLLFGVSGVVVTEELLNIAVVLPLPLEVAVTVVL